MEGKKKPKETSASHANKDFCVEYVCDNILEKICKTKLTQGITSLKPVLLKQKLDQKTSLKNSSTLADEGNMLLQNVGICYPHCTA
jgi:hypothetical protein